MNFWIEQRRLQQDGLTHAFYSNDTRPFFDRFPQADIRLPGFSGPSFQVDGFQLVDVSPPVKTYVAPATDYQLGNSLIIPTQVTAVDSPRDPVGSEFSPSSSASAPGESPSSLSSLSSSSVSSSSSSSSSSVSSSSSIPSSSSSSSSLSSSSLSSSSSSSSSEVFPGVDTFCTSQSQWGTNPELYPGEQINDSDNGQIENVFPIPTVQPIQISNFGEELNLGAVGVYAQDLGALPGLTVQQAMPWVPDEYPVRGELAGVHAQLVYGDQTASPSGPCYYDFTAGAASFVREGLRYFYGSTGGESQLNTAGVYAASTDDAKDDLFSTYFVGTQGDQWQESVPFNFAQGISTRSDILEANTLQIFATIPLPRLRQNGTLSYDGSGAQAFIRVVLDPRIGNPPKLQIAFDDIAIADYSLATQSIEMLGWTHSYNQDTTWRASQMRVIWNVDYTNDPGSLYQNGALFGQQEIELRLAFGIDNLVTS